jgi:glycosyltransferase involved in cell wall biosynthesis
VADRRTVLYLERNVDGTIGGSYRSLLYLVKGLPKDAYEPIAVFYRAHHLVEEFKKAGCQVLLLRYPSTVRLVDRLPILRRWRLPAPISAAVRLLQKGLNFVHGAGSLFVLWLFVLLKERVHVVHLNNGVMSGTELLLASCLLGVKTVVHQRGIGELPNAFKGVRPLIDHVICVSDAARENLIVHGLPPERCTTVHNGIDPDEFRASIARSPQAVRGELGITDDTVVVGNAGMVKEWKGQLVLAQAIEKVWRSHPRLRCVIVGGTSDQHGEDAAYLRRIQEYIHEHELGGRIQLVDYQQNVAEFIQVFDIMVHTATAPEPFSRSVLEGMTLGRAMIATRTGGTPEAIEDGVSGILVRPNDPTQLAEQIDRLAREPALRRELGVRAQERIRDRFLIRTNVESTQRIYERVLRGGRAQ